MAMTSQHHVLQSAGVTAVEPLPDLPRNRIGDTHKLNAGQLMDILLMDPGGRGLQVSESEIELFIAADSL